MNRLMLILLATAVGVIGCGEAEMEEVPETAEVEIDPIEREMELEEETMLGLDDVGETLMATGWVVGVPLDNGFYLRTEDDRVIFVQTDTEVETGKAVRVWGPLAATETVVFDEWEIDAFDTGFEAEWDVETALYIQATRVTEL